MSERTDLVLSETAAQLERIVSALSKENDEDQSSNLPVWNKDMSLPEMDSYWVFSVTVNDDDGTGDKTEKCLVGLLENPDDAYDNWPVIHILAIVKDSNDSQHLWVQGVDIGDIHQLETTVKQGNQTYDTNDWMFRTNPDHWEGNEEYGIPASLNPTWTQVDATEAARLYSNRTCSYQKVEVRYGQDQQNPIVESALFRTDDTNGKIEVLKTFKAEGKDQAYVTFESMPEEIIYSGSGGVFRIINSNAIDNGYSDEDFEPIEGRWLFMPLDTPYGSSITTWDEGYDYSSATTPYFTALTVEQASALYNS